MLAVLSPAKTLDFESPIQAVKPSEARMLDRSDYLIGKLQKLSPGQIAKLMGVNPEIAALNHDRFAAWKLPFPKGASRPAMLAFRGDVYRGLAAQDIGVEDLEFAQQSLRILSGLYGLLRPLDAMLPYRLEMGSRLKITAKKTGLYTYWGTDIQSALLNDLGDAPLINLASNEYFKALQAKDIPNRIITCHFRQLKNGEYKPLMTYAKQGRGYMARFIVENRITQAEDLKGFDLKKYQFNPSLSDENDWVFTRDEVEL